VFARTETGVNSVPRFVKGPIIDEGDGLGFTVAASPTDGSFAIGAPREGGSQTGPTADPKDDGATEAGAVFIFTPDP
jgi:hypothetical protein